MEKIIPCILENKRITGSTALEHYYWASDQLICGIDEAGRGPLAGPVVAAAVILNKDSTSPLLKDSKVLSQKQLKTAYEWIKMHGLYGVGIVSPHIIDTRGILFATRLAMTRALAHVVNYLSPLAVVVDAVEFDCSFVSHEMHRYVFCKAESRSISVAAASIVAKVIRDSIMFQYEACLSQYGFSKHKGYGTALHYQELLQNSMSIIHRTTFLKGLAHDTYRNKWLKK